VSGRDCFQRDILENVVPALGKRRPGLRLNSISLQELLGRALLKKGIDANRTIVAAVGLKVE